VKARILLLAAIAAALLAAPAQAKFVEPRLSKLATVLVGRPVRIVCVLRQEEWLRDRPSAVLQEEAGTGIAAYAPVGGGTAVLGPDACALARAAAADPTGRSRFRCDTSATCIEAVDADAFGFFVLAHESMHLRGIANEDQASCAGLRAFPRLLRAAGVPSARATRILRAARRDFRPDGCRL
jgi:hypothetical protein